ncbi:hypothetical protein [Bradyrhizobium sp. LVM 105]|uniref:hypothetical protein n=1 Tax=Bradyrhizobium sp. LVM 105 TaxID=2341115 RepID=UPI000F80B521|nr:hypothetical protein [Bradyrhizobium sp. LVM 105]RTE91886.1 hypothetical protein D6B98_15830 [Bradyrhizobium sp. LVM 105]
MNQHLPPSNLREVTFAKPAVTEQFIVIRGTRRGNVSYVEDTLMGRADVIAHVSEDIEQLHQVIAFDLGNGTSRDATSEITSIIFERWAQDSKELTRSQRDAVASFRGEAFANCFRVEAA